MLVLRVPANGESELVFEKEDFRKVEVRGQALFRGCVIDKAVCVSSSCRCVFEQCIVLELILVGKASVTCREGSQLSSVSVVMGSHLSALESSLDAVLICGGSSVSFARCVLRQVLATRSSGQCENCTVQGGKGVSLGGKCFGWKVAQCEFRDCRPRALLLGARDSSKLCCTVSGCRFVGNETAV